MKKKLLKGLSLVLFLALLVSCASTRTRQDQYIETEGFLAQRDYAAAAQVIDSAKQDAYKEKDRVLFYLDIGMLYHYAGEYELSNQMLTEAEYAIEELYTKSISRGIGSGILNDNALDYSGEDYEDIYLNIFKALNYIAMDDLEAAMVEVRRIDNKLNLLADRNQEEIDQFNDSGEEIQAKLGEVEANFHNDALARLLGLLMYRFEGSMDDARIDGEKIDEAFFYQSHLYNFPQPPMPNLNPENVPVNFVIFTGRSPNKVAETYYIDSSNDVIYFTKVEQDGEDYLRDIAAIEDMYVPGVSPGFHMKIQFPRLYLRGSDVTEIKISVDGQRYDVHMIENMENIAEQTFLLRQPLIIAKTVTRAIIKGIAKEATQEVGSDAIEDNVGGIGGLLLGLAFEVGTDIAVDATENADLRISQFFPAYAYTAELELEPGSYDIRIEYYGPGGLLYADDLGTQEITGEEFNLFESFYM